MPDSPVCARATHMPRIGREYERFCQDSEWGVRRRTARVQIRTIGRDWVGVLLELSCRAGRV